jgi:hypothetical protein
MGDSLASRKSETACISGETRRTYNVVAPKCRLRNGAAAASAAVTRVNGSRGLGIGRRLREDGRNGEEGSERVH